MAHNTYIRNLIFALSGIVIGLMSVSLAFDFALYVAPTSVEAEQDATRYYHIVRTSFVPLIVMGTLILLIAAAIYRLIFARNWRTYLFAVGIFGLSLYYLLVVFALEDNLPNVTDFDERVASLITIGFAHLLTWLAGWFTLVVMFTETDDTADR